MIATERIGDFVNLWNETDVATVAETFGITRSYASVIASELRFQGHMLELRSNNQKRVMISEAERRALDHMLISLCFVFDTCPVDVLSGGRIGDGRIAVRKALAYAGHRLCKISWKRLGIYFGRNHSSCAGWCAAAKKRHHDAANRAYAEWLAADKPEIAEAA